MADIAAQLHSLPLKPAARQFLFAEFSTQARMVILKHKLRTNGFRTLAVNHIFSSFTATRAPRYPLLTGFGGENFSHRRRTGIVSP